MRRVLALTAAAAVAITAVVAVNNSDTDFFPVGPFGDGPGAAGALLETYSSCDALSEDLAMRALHGGGAFGRGGDTVFAEQAMDGGSTSTSGSADQAAAPAPNAAVAATGGGTTDTNVAVAGIDEPDLVETDGRRVFSVVGEGDLMVVDVTSSTPTLLSRVSLGENGWNQLLLDGDRLLVVGQIWGGVMFGRADDAAVDSMSFAPMSAGVTRLQLFDVSTDIPTQIATTDIEGSVVATRGVGSVVHVVTQHWPQPVPFETLDAAWQTTDPEGAIAAAYAAAPGEAWLPRVGVTDDATGATMVEPMACDAVSYVPATWDQGLLAINTFDLGTRGLAPTGQSAIVSDGQSVTATADRLVVATTVYPQFDGGIGVIEPMPLPLPELGDPPAIDNLLIDPPAPDQAPAPGESPPADEPLPTSEPTTEPTGLLPTTEIPVSPAEPTEVVATEPSPTPGTQIPTDPTSPTESSTPDSTDPTGTPEPTTETLAPTATATPEPTTTATDVPTGPSTLLHLFAIGRDGASHLASGSVDGYLINQFAMSIQGADLRVATTIENWNNGASESQLSVLRQQDSDLVTVGHVGGLGLTEVIQSVRFLGDAAYVVTFRQTDPLYAIDLRDPTNPVVTGELKITGFSSYLHPLPDGRLLGIGQEATEDGRTTGLQVQIFDVRNPAAPIRTSQLVFEGAGSQAEYDHLAVTYHDGRLFLPYVRYGGFVDDVVTEESSDGAAPDQAYIEDFDAGVIVIDAERDLLTEVARLTMDVADPYAREVQRILVVDGNAVLVGWQRMDVYGPELQLRGSITN